MTFSPNSEYTFSGSDKGIRVWRVKDGKHIETMGVEQVVCLAVSKDGWIAAGTVFGDMLVWDANTYKYLSVTRGSNTVEPLVTHALYNP